MKDIGFNKPYLTGNETDYITDAVASCHVSGNGKYTKLCQAYFEKRYSFKKCLLTTSCTDALEMAAILLNIGKGDEVIMPSYTFVSTANPFVLRGATITFADSKVTHPSIDEDKIENLISPKTKAIVVVHYAGVACDMDKIMRIAKAHNLYVIEDAAQAIDNYFIGKDGIQKPLGSIGDLGTFSFHETKNIIAGEGGMLVINDSTLIDRAEIIWEKGTNRSAFFRGDVAKYNWVDVGSSFLPSDIIAAFLWAQLENLDEIQTKRKEIWANYYSGLKHLEDSNKLKLPQVADYSTNNAHMFYLLCDSVLERDQLIKYLKSHKVNAVFHYLSLHKSPFYKNNYSGDELPYADMYSDCLVRLPMYYELTRDELNYIVNRIAQFYS